MNWLIISELHWSSLMYYTICVKGMTIIWIINLYNNMVVYNMCKNNKSICLQDAWSVRRGSTAMFNVKALVLQ